jgi:hypothetical protein
MNRALDLQAGRAYVVTDLHGAWGPYLRYRDHFLALRDRGEADCLIFLGDVIHGYGPPEEDYSLPMLWDIMRLQAELGPQSAIMLLGNHELPHLYGITLTKGGITFTPRFEHTLGEHRERIISFIDSLPFLIRTPAGVLLTHAGASMRTATRDAARQLLAFSHRDLLDEADRLMARKDVLKLVRAELHMTPQEYESEAWRNLAVAGREDPRFHHLLRGFIVGSLEPEWPLLWDFFFTQCEIEVGLRRYEQLIGQFLELYSDPSTPQRILVSGHMPVQGGYQIIAGCQLRLASWMHAQPRDTACYLLFDVTAPAENAAELARHVHPMP